MTDRRTKAAPGARPGTRFETTRWSVVLAARGSDPERAKAAMSTLCGQYWFPLYAFLRSRRHSPEEAEDLTQGFFAHLLEKESLRHVDPGRGRFRGFLLASCKNYVADQRTRGQAKKRGGGEVPLSLDREDAEGRLRYEPIDDLTPERIFERQWALAVIERALANLRERYESAGKAEHFDVMKVFLSGEKRPMPHSEVAERLGLSELAVKVAVHRLRKRFRDSLHDEIAQTVSGESEVDDELRALYAALES